MSDYTVKPGDSLSRIAASEGVSLQTLLAANPQISNPDLIHVGDEIRLPGAEADAPPSVQAGEQADQRAGTHIVRSGDSLSAIASAHGISVADLLAANPQITNPDVIRVDDRIAVPQASARRAEQAPPEAMEQAGEDAQLLGDNDVDGCVSGCGGQGQDAAAGADAISDDGLDFIADHEGFVGELYDDPAGHCTIGYGHLVHRGPCTDQDRAQYPNGISQQDARELLRDDAQIAVDAVNANVDVPLNQNQFDALVSFTFNVGAGNLQSSTLLRRLNDSQYDQVPGQLDRWVYSDGQRLPGLVNRRDAEGELFEAPVEPAGGGE